MDEIGVHSSFHLGNYPSAKLKLDELFVEWLTAEGSSSICSMLLDSLSIADDGDGHDAHGQRLRDTYRSPKKRSQSEMLSNRMPSPTSSPSSSSGNKVGAVATTTAVSKDAQARINAASTPASGTSKPGSAVTAVTAHSSEEKGSAQEDAEDSHTAMRRRSNFDTIPQFYVRGQRSNHLRHISEDDQLSKRLPEIEAFFRPFPGGIPVEKFVHVTKRLCGIPSFFNLPLCRRINEVYGDADCGIPPPRTIGRSGRHPSGVKIKLKTFLKFWSAEVEPYDRLERFFRVIKKHDADFIYKDDFIPFLQELLHFHPGLDFLEAHEEFQRKYALTVITRIFYCVNTSRTGKLSMKEVRNSNLFNACMHVDEETDINRVVEYFSYEHFYVLYCKFFELDLDKDSKLSRDDLMKYGEHSLSEAIVDRIFQVGTRVFSDGQVGNFDSTGGMTYPDFIFFMLSEEDKSSEAALRYWFSCCDLDGDGFLSSQEMRHFYAHQIQRVTSLGQESIHFHDVLCQMIDMISPKDMHAITIDDILVPNKRTICGVLFDILFNLHKFMRFETRDPFQEKLRREDVHHSDWDRYAHIEYNRLAQEEEGYDASAEMDLQQYIDEPQVGQQMQQQQQQQQVGAGGASGGDAAMGSHWSLNDEADDDDDDLVYHGK